MFKCWGSKKTKKTSETENSVDENDDEISSSRREDGGTYPSPSEYPEATDLEKDMHAVPSSEPKRRHTVTSERSTESSPDRFQYEQGAWFYPWTYSSGGYDHSRMREKAIQTSVSFHEEPGESSAANSLPLTANQSDPRCAPSSSSRSFSSSSRLHGTGSSHRHKVETEAVPRKYSLHSARSDICHNTPRKTRRTYNDFLSAEPDLPKAFTVVNPLEMRRKNNMEKQFELRKLSRLVNPRWNSTDMPSSVVSVQNRTSVYPKGTTTPVVQEKVTFPENPPDSKEDSTKIQSPNPAQGTELPQLNVQALMAIPSLAWQVTSPATPPFQATPLLNEGSILMVASPQGQMAPNKQPMVQSYFPQNIQWVLPTQPLFQERGRERELSDTACSHDRIADRRSSTRGRRLAQKREGGIWLPDRRDGCPLHPSEEDEEDLEILLDREFRRCCCLQSRRCAEGEADSSLMCPSSTHRQRGKVYTRSRTVSPQYRSRSSSPIRRSQTPSPGSTRSPAYEHSRALSPRPARRMAESSLGNVEGYEVVVDGNLGQETSMTEEEQEAVAGGTRIVRTRQASIWLRDREDGSPYAVDDVEVELQKLLSTGIERSNTPQGDRPNSRACRPRSQRNRAASRTTIRSSRSLKAISTVPQCQRTTRLENARTCPDCPTQETIDDTHGSSDDENFEEEMRLVMEKILALQMQHKAKCFKEQNSLLEKTKLRSTTQDPVQGRDESTFDKDTSFFPLMSSTPVKQSQPSVKSSSIDQNPSDANTITTDLLSEMDELKRSMADLLQCRDSLQDSVDHLLQSKSSLLQNFNKLKDEFQRHSGHSRANFDELQHHTATNRSGATEEERRRKEREGKFQPRNTEKVASRQGASLRDSRIGNDEPLSLHTMGGQWSVVDAATSSSQTENTEELESVQAKARSSKAEVSMQTSFDDGYISDNNDVEEAERPYSPCQREETTIERLADRASTFADRIKREMSAVENQFKWEPVPLKQAAPDESQGFAVCTSCGYTQDACICGQGSENNNSDRHPDIDETYETAKSSTGATTTTQKRTIKEWRSATTTGDPDGRFMDPYNPFPPYGLMDNVGFDPNSPWCHSFQDHMETAGPFKQRHGFMQERNVFRGSNKPSKKNFGYHETRKSTMKSESSLEDELQNDPMTHTTTQKGTTNINSVYNEEVHVFQDSPKDDARNSQGPLASGEEDGVSRLLKSTDMKADPAGVNRAHRDKDVSYVSKRESRQGCKGDKKSRIYYNEDFIKCPMSQKTRTTSMKHSKRKPKGTAPRETCRMRKDQTGKSVKLQSSSSEGAEVPLYLNSANSSLGRNSPARQRRAARNYSVSCERPQYRDWSPNSPEYGSVHGPRQAYLTAEGIHSNALPVTAHRQTDRGPWGSHSSTRDTISPNRIPDQFLSVPHASVTTQYTQKMKDPRNGKETVSSYSRAVEGGVTPDRDRWKRDSVYQVKTSPKQSTAFEQENYGSMYHPNIQVQDEIPERDQREYLVDDLAFKSSYSVPEEEVSNRYANRGVDICNDYPQRNPSPSENLVIHKSTQERHFFRNESYCDNDTSPDKAPTSSNYDEKMSTRRYQSSVIDSHPHSNKVSMDQSEQITEKQGPPIKFSKKYDYQIRRDIPGSSSAPQGRPLRIEELDSNVTSQWPRSDRRQSKSTKRPSSTSPSSGEREYPKYVEERRTRSVSSVRQTPQQDYSGAQMERNERLLTIARYPPKEVVQTEDSYFADVDTLQGSVIEQTTSYYSSGVKDIRNEHATLSAERRSEFGQDHDGNKMRLIQRSDEHSVNVVMSKDDTSDTTRRFFIPQHGLPQLEIKIGIKSPRPSSSYASHSLTVTDTTKDSDSRGSPAIRLEVVDTTLDAQHQAVTGTDSGMIQARAVHSPMNLQAFKYENVGAKSVNNGCAKMQECTQISTNVQQTPHKIHSMQLQLTKSETRDEPEVILGLMIKEIDSDSKGEQSHYETTISRKAPDPETGYKLSYHSNVDKHCVQRSSSRESERTEQSVIRQEKNTTSFVTETVQSTDNRHFPVEKTSVERETFVNEQILEQARKETTRSEAIQEPRPAKQEKSYGQMTQKQDKCCGVSIMRKKVVQHPKMSSHPEKFTQTNKHAAHVKEEPLQHVMVQQQPQKDIYNISSSVTKASKETMTASMKQPDRCVCLLQSTESKNTSTTDFDREIITKNTFDCKGSQGNQGRMTTEQYAAVSAVSYDASLSQKVSVLSSDLPKDYRIQLPLGIELVPRDAADGKKREENETVPVHMSISRDGVIVSPPPHLENYCLQLPLGRNTVSVDTELTARRSESCGRAEQSGIKTTSRLAGDHRIIDKKMKEKSLPSEHFRSGPQERRVPSEEVRLFVTGNTLQASQYHQFAKQQPENTFEKRINNAPEKLSENIATLSSLYSTPLQPESQRFERPPETGFVFTRHNTHEDPCYKTGVKEQFPNHAHRSWQETVYTMKVNGQEPAYSTGYCTRVQEQEPDYTNRVQESESMYTNRAEIREPDYTNRVQESESMHTNRSQMRKTVYARDIQEQEADHISRRQEQMNTKRFQKQDHSYTSTVQEHEQVYIKNIQQQEPSHINKNQGYGAVYANKSNGSESIQMDGIQKQKPVFSNVTQDQELFYASGVRRQDPVYTKRAQEQESAYISLGHERQPVQVERVKRYNEHDEPLFVTRGQEYELVYMNGGQRQEPVSTRVQEKESDSITRIQEQETAYASKTEQEAAYHTNRVQQQNRFHASRAEGHDPAYTSRFQKSEPGHTKRGQESKSDHSSAVQEQNPIYTSGSTEKYKEKYKARMKAVYTSSLTNQESCDTYRAGQQESFSTSSNDEEKSMPTSRDEKINVDRLVDKGKAMHHELKPKEKHKKKKEKKGKRNNDKTVTVSSSSKQSSEENEVESPETSNKNAADDKNTKTALLSENRAIPSAPPATEFLEMYSETRQLPAPLPVSNIVLQQQQQEPFLQCLPQSLNEQTSVFPVFSKPADYAKKMQKELSTLTFPTETTGMDSSQKRKQLYSNSLPQPMTNIVRHNPEIKQVFSPTATLTVANHVYLSTQDREDVLSSLCLRKDNESSTTENRSSTTENRSSTTENRSSTTENRSSTTETRPVQQKSDAQPSSSLKEGSTSFCQKYVQHGEIKEKNPILPLTNEYKPPENRDRRHCHCDKVQRCSCKDREHDPRQVDSPSFLPAQACCSCTTKERTCPNVESICTHYCSLSKRSEPEFCHVCQKQVTARKMTQSEEDFSCNNKPTGHNASSIVNSEPNHRNGPSFTKDPGTNNVVHHSHRTYSDARGQCPSHASTLLLKCHRNPVLPNFQGKTDCLEDAKLPLSQTEDTSCVKQKDFPLEKECQKQRVAVSFEPSSTNMPARETACTEASSSSSIRMVGTPYCVSCHSHCLHQQQTTMETGMHTDDLRSLHFHHCKETEKLRQKIKDLKSQQQQLISQVKSDCVNLVDQEVKVKEAQLQEERISKAKLKDAVVALQKQLVDMERENWRTSMAREAAKQSIATDKVKLESQLENIQHEAEHLRTEKEDLASKLNTIQEAKTTLEQQLNDTRFTSRERELISCHQAAELSNYKNLVDFCNEKYLQQRDNAVRLQEKLEEVTKRLEERAKESEKLKSQLEMAKTVILKRRQQVEQLKMMQIELRTKCMEEQSMSAVVVKEKKAIEDKLHLETDRYSSLLDQVDRQNKRLMNVRSKVESLDPDRLKQQFEIRFRTQVDLVLRQVNDILEQRAAVAEEAEIRQQEMNFQQRAHEANVKMLQKRNQQLRAMKKMAETEERLLHDLSTTNTFLPEPQRLSTRATLPGGPEIIPDKGYTSNLHEEGGVYKANGQTAECSHLFPHTQDQTQEGHFSSRPTTVHWQEPVSHGKINEKARLDLKMMALKKKMQDAPWPLQRDFSCDSHIPGRFCTVRSESRSFLASIRVQQPTSGCSTDPEPQNMWVTSNTSQVSTKSSCCCRHSPNLREPDVPHRLRFASQGGIQTENTRCHPPFGLKHGGISEKHCCATSGYSQPQVTLQGAYNAQVAQELPNRSGFDVQTSDYLFSQRGHDEERERRMPFQCKGKSGDPFGQNMHCEGRNCEEYFHHNIHFQRENNRMEPHQRFISHENDTCQNYEHHPMSFEMRHYASVQSQKQDKRKPDLRMKSKSEEKFVYHSDSAPQSNWMDGSSKRLNKAKPDSETSHLSMLSMSPRISTFNSSATFHNEMGTDNDCTINSEYLCNMPRKEHNQIKNGKFLPLNYNTSSKTPSNFKRPPPGYTRQTSMLHDDYKQNPGTSKQDKPQPQDSGTVMMQISHITKREYIYPKQRISERGSIENDKVLQINSDDRYEAHDQHRKIIFAKKSSPSDKEMKCKESLSEKSSATTQISFMRSTGVTFHSDEETEKSTQTISEKPHTVQAVSATQTGYQVWFSDYQETAAVQTSDSISDAPCLFQASTRFARSDLSAVRNDTETIMKPKSAGIMAKDTYSSNVMFSSSEDFTETSHMVMGTQTNQSLLSLAYEDQDIQSVEMPSCRVVTGTQTTASLQSVDLKRNREQSSHVSEGYKLTTYAHRIKSTQTNPSLLNIIQDSKDCTPDLVLTSVKHSKVATQTNLSSTVVNQTHMESIKASRRDKASQKSDLHSLQERKAVSLQANQKSAGHSTPVTATTSSLQAKKLEQITLHRQGREFKSNTDHCIQQTFQTCAQTSSPEQACLVNTGLLTSQWDGGIDLRSNLGGDSVDPVNLSPSSQQKKQVLSNEMSVTNAVTQTFRSTLASGSPQKNVEILSSKDHYVSQKKTEPSAEKRKDISWDKPSVSHSAKPHQADTLSQKYKAITEKQNMMNKEQLCNTSIHSSFHTTTSTIRRLSDESKGMQDRDGESLKTKPPYYAGVQNYEESTSHVSSSTVSILSCSSGNFHMDQEFDVARMQSSGKPQPLSQSYQSHGMYTVHAQQKKNMEKDLWEMLNSIEERVQQISAQASTNLHSLQRWDQIADQDSSNTPKPVTGGKNSEISTAETVLQSTQGNIVTKIEASEASVKQSEQPSRREPLSCVMASSSVLTGSAKGPQVLEQPVTGTGAVATSGFLSTHITRECEAHTPSGALSTAENVSTSVVHQDVVIPPSPLPQQSTGVPQKALQPVSGVSSISVQQSPTPSILPGAPGIPAMSSVLSAADSTQVNQGVFPASVNKPAHFTMPPSGIQAPYATLQTSALQPQTNPPPPPGVPHMHASQFVSGAQAATGVQFANSVFQSDSQPRSPVMIPPGLQPSFGQQHTQIVVPNAALQITSTEQSTQHTSMRKSDAGCIPPSQSAGLQTPSVSSSPPQFHHLSPPSQSVQMSHTAVYDPGPARLNYQLLPSPQNAEKPVPTVPSPPYVIDAVQFPPTFYHLNMEIRPGVPSPYVYPNTVPQHMYPCVSHPLIHPRAWGVCPRDSSLLPAGLGMVNQPCNTNLTLNRMPYPHAHFALVQNEPSKLHCSSSCDSHRVCQSSSYSGPICVSPASVHLDACHAPGLYPPLYQEQQLREMAHPGIARCSQVSQQKKKGKGKSVRSVIKSPSEICSCSKHNIRKVSSKHTQQRRCVTVQKHPHATLSGEQGMQSDTDNNSNWMSNLLKAVSPPTSRKPLKKSDSQQSHKDPFIM